MKKLFSLLLDAAPADGNGNPPAGDNIPVTGVIPPPVATAAMNGNVSEREADLQSQIDVLRAERDGERGSKVKLEKDIAFLQDKLNALQNPPRDPGKPERDDRSELEKFMAGE